MRVGFIVTATYQLFHYREFQRHLDDTVAFIEVRDKEFGVTRDVVSEHLPGVDIQLIGTSQLADIDGACDVLVCQTPVPLMKFFQKSLMVAQQYSLAKEVYQYGLWRAQANLNLMYGDYSQARVCGFSNAVAAGNPLLDMLFAGGAVPERPSPPNSGGLRALYMPTYGDLSDRESVLRDMVAQGLEVSVKAHHADFEIIDLAQSCGLTTYLSDRHPIELIVDHDLVVSDYSGAIYDGLAARKPVVVTGALNEESKDLSRLSEEDRSRSEVEAMTGLWQLGDPIEAAYSVSMSALQSDSDYAAYLDRFYASRGHAGARCAEEIQRLAEFGEPENFGVNQVRQTVRDYVRTNRRLRRQAKRASKQAAGRGGSAGGKARSVPAKIRVLKAARWGLLHAPGGERLLDFARSLRHGSDALDEDDVVAVDLGLPVVPQQRRAATLALVEDWLRQHQVEFATYDGLQKTYCAVKPDQEEALFGAFQALADDESGLAYRAWVSRGARYGKARLLSSVQATDLTVGDSIAIGVPYRNEKLSVARAGAVELLFLEPRDERLVARQWRAEKIDWTGEFAASEGGTSDRAASVHVLANQPVDIVYTWVDSSDKEWRDARRSWAERQHIAMVSADNEERFIDREELRYSLRSIHLYAPFVRNIYIVTAGQKPHWLDTNHEKIHLVDHREIFPDPEQLPTFNSHAIEACLHRIPDLAEHFIYFNDDVFLGRESTVEAFYTRGGLIKSRFSPVSFTASSRPGEAAIPTDWASFNAIRLMERDFGLHFDRKMKHIPMPMKKSLLEEIEQRYPEQMRQTRSARFRSHDDISFVSMFAHYFAIARGEGVEWAHIPGEYAYADTGRRDFMKRLRAITRNNPLFVCMNVTLHDDIPLDEQAVLLQTFLSERYSIPSPFERETEQSGAVVSRAEA